MTDLLVPAGKRPRAPSFVDKHPETHAASTALDLFPEKEISPAPVDNFLEICRFCNKSLRQDEDIFMYGYFGAFCTKQCRVKQMACDIFAESSSREKVVAKKVRTWRTKPKEESKDEALENGERITTPLFYI